ncbi:MAG: DNRLRE domain-containing protein [Candidatus Thorarchaeota archaeon]
MAQKALEILIDENYPKWKWLDDREKLFLTATEAPDNNNLEMILNGELVQGYGDFVNHHVYFHENGSVKDDEDNAAIRAQDCYDMAEIALKEKKFDLAAFYFGTMTHYIADCTMYAHVAQNYVHPYNVNFDQWHSIVEKLVNARTNISNNREIFFNYTAQPGMKGNPYNITLEVGWDTYKDPNPSKATIRDAIWLHNNYFPDWALDQTERLAETNQTRILYYDRIEENLKKAIEGCVAAINYSGVTQTVFAEEDAHVYSRYPDSNYGDETRMYLGNWNDGAQTYQDEVYLSFDISPQRKNWKNVELYLYITDFPAPAPLDFEICQITESWVESSITWNNKPAHGASLTNLTISQNGVKTVNLTKFISGTSFSICIFAEVSQWETIRIHSSEHSSLSSKPKLVFTYKELDYISPEIHINSPDDNELFGFEAPNFDLTIIDQSLNATWFTLDGGLKNITFSGLTGSINQSEWGKMPSGPITLRFYANDSFGNLGFRDIDIVKDIKAPKITIISPTPYQLCGVNAPSFNLQINEPNLQEKWYSLNGGDNVTFTTQTVFDQIEWGNTGNGTVVIKFYAIDMLGNLNSSEVIVRKDAYIPEIIINSPLENQTFGRIAPSFNLSIIEDDLVSTWYTLTGVSENFDISSLYGTIDQATWNRLPKGEITISFYAQDTAGNIGIKTVKIIKSITSGTPANLAILLGGIIGAVGVGGVSIVVFRKKISKYIKPMVKKLKESFRRNNAE